MPNILIRCDAGLTVGFGHVVRCLALAHALRQHSTSLITFAMTEDASGNKKIIDANFPLETILTTGLNSEIEHAWLDQVITKLNISILILDIRTKLSFEHVESLRSKVSNLVCIDDLSERRLAADQIFFPPIPQLTTLDWAGFNGVKYVGWDWILMPNGFGQAKINTHTPRRTCAIPRLLVTMGGSDPYGLTARVLGFLDTLVGAYEIDLVIGPGFTNPSLLVKIAHGFNHEVKVHHNPNNLAELMMRSDLALASFGASAYELTAMGVPTVYFALSEDHAKSCDALVKSGAAICIGIHDKIADHIVQNALEKLIANKYLRQQMHQTCLQLIDAAGAVRVAHTILNYSAKNADQPRNPTTNEITTGQLKT